MSSPASKSSLLYLTQARSRYPAAPALADAAVYVKTGSLYACAGGCEKFKGTVRNIMNTIAIVESPAHHNRIRYLVAMSSNVLRVNSAELHAEIAGRLEALMNQRHPPTAKDIADARAEAIKFAEADRLEAESRRLEQQAAQSTKGADPRSR